ncbi:MAG: aspartate/glutamate racemase family protein [Silvanigrellaceae bacterium]|nr:aspartate/glutamate racemase family protein [Silvanigrellaceae bacterium]
MKTIGLIGGMSWKSTSEYYRIINEEIKNRLGGSHSGKIILYSLDFAEIEALQFNGNWQKAGEIISKAASTLDRAGVDIILICTNTMHKLIDYVYLVTKIPLLHIADATANCIINSKISKVGLLGTNFTMEQDFYKGRLKNNFNLEVIIPEEKNRKIIQRIIYEELCKDIISQQSKNEFLRIINDLIKSSGIEGIILGCTEIELLITQEDFSIPVFPTAKIHSMSAVDFALSDTSSLLS